jgi:tetratricopeptide (TPR) repeat protein
VGQVLVDLARTLIDAGRYEEATSRAIEALRIAAEIDRPPLGSWGHQHLALARLCIEDLPNARAAAEAARRYDVSPNNHNVLALLGLIALRQGDLDAGREAFASAVARADVMLKRTAGNYDALDAKGLALSGLAMCEDGRRVPEAIAVYRAARAINRDAGIVGRVLRLLAALVPADVAGVLAGVREAAAGEEPT